MPFAKFLRSSIGLKLLMSLTGLAMALFLLAHMLGNLLIFLGAARFNLYSHSITSNALLLYPAEAGLILAVLVHIMAAIRVTQKNSCARPVPYALRADTKRSRRFFGSSNMGISGTLILIFIAFHLYHFKFGTEYHMVIENLQVRDLARNVFQDFHKPFYVVVYVLAMIVIFIHLIHGFRSSFETLGVTTQAKSDRFFRYFSCLFVSIVMGGFVLIPLLIFIFRMTE